MLPCTERPVGAGKLFRRLTQPGMHAVGSGLNFLRADVAASCEVVCGINVCRRIARVKFQYRGKVRALRPRRVVGQNPFRPVGQTPAAFAGQGANLPTRETVTSCLAGRARRIATQATCVKRDFDVENRFGPTNRTQKQGRADHDSNDIDAGPARHWAGASRHHNGWQALLRFPPRQKWGLPVGLATLSRT